VFAQRQQRGAFRLLAGGQAFPISGADGAEENGLRVAAALQRVVGQGVADWSMAAPPTAYSFASISKPNFFFGPAPRTSRPTP